MQDFAALNDAEVTRGVASRVEGLVALLRQLKVKDVMTVVAPDSPDAFQPHALHRARTDACELNQFAGEKAAEGVAGKQR